MPFKATKNGFSDKVDALTTSSQIESSAVKSNGIKYYCVECRQVVVFINKCEKYQAHFRHKIENKECSESHKWDISYNEPELVTSDFVKKWQQEYEPYKCLENNMKYNFGSEKGFLVIRDKVHAISQKHKINPKIPLVFILNSTHDIRNVLLRKADDLYYLSFRIKSEQLDILDIGGILCVDIGKDHLYRITKREYLPEKFKKNGDFPAFRCEIISINSVIKFYFPDGFTIPPREVHTFDDLEILEECKPTVPLQLSFNRSIYPSVSATNSIMPILPTIKPTQDLTVGKTCKCSLAIPCSCSAPRYELVKINNQMYCTNCQKWKCRC